MRGALPNSTSSGMSTGSSPNNASVSRIYRIGIYNISEFFPLQRGFDILDPFDRLCTLCGLAELDLNCFRAVFLQGDLGNAFQVVIHVALQDNLAESPVVSTKAIESLLPVVGLP